MLTKFSDQYKDENKKFVKVEISKGNFALHMGYEVSYKSAVKKAKKLKKNIMLVIVSNYCPWCHKFQQRVLRKQDVNKVVQKNYIPVILNKEKDDFPKELNTSFTPVVHFISYKTLKSYKTIIGYNHKDKFFHVLKTDKLK